MKIYDCFQFFNELDLLEIRLELLYDYVDFFVISETSKTHSNLDKPYYFEENKHLFEKYMDKIIHIKTDYPNNILKFEKREEDTPYNRQLNKISDIYDMEEHEGQLKQWPNFCRDYLQREYLKFGLLDCEDDDLIMVSDLDEISNPEAIREIREKHLTNYVLLQNCCYFYVNILAHTNWYGAYVVEYRRTKDVSLTHIRGHESQKYDKIVDGGWHLSFVGGAARVKEKIISYSHQEFNNPNVLSQIENKMQQNRDPFGRSNNTYRNEIQTFHYDNMLVLDMSIYPENMKNMIEEKFKYLIK